MRRSFISRENSSLLALDASRNIIQQERERIGNVGDEVVLKEKFNLISLYNFLGKGPYIITEIHEPKNTNSSKGKKTLNKLPIGLSITIKTVTGKLHTLSSSYFDPQVKIENV